MLAGIFAVDRNEDGGNAGGGERVQLARQQPAIGHHGGLHAHIGGHLHHIGDARMQQRLATHEGDEADIGLGLHERQGFGEARGVHRAPVGDETLVMGEVAEVAGRIAQVGDRSIENGRATAGHKAEQVHQAGTGRRHGESFEDGTVLPELAGKAKREAVLLQPQWPITLEGEAI